jgi:hypothetical protein
MERNVNELLKERTVREKFQYRRTSLLWIVLIILVSTDGSKTLHISASTWSLPPTLFGAGHGTSDDDRFPTQLLRRRSILVVKRSSASRLTLQNHYNSPTSELLTSPATEIKSRLDEFWFKQTKPFSTELIKRQSGNESSVKIQNSVHLPPEKRLGTTVPRIKARSKKWHLRNPRAGLEWRAREK